MLLIFYSTLICAVPVLILIVAASAFLNGQHPII